MKSGRERGGMPSKNRSAESSAFLTSTTVGRRRRRWPGVWVSTIYFSPRESVVQKNPPAPRIERKSRRLSSVDAINSRLTPALRRRSALLEQSTNFAPHTAYYPTLRRVASRRASPRRAAPLDASLTREPLKRARVRSIRAVETEVSTSRGRG